MLVQNCRECWLERNTQTDDLILVPPKLINAKFLNQNIGFMTTSVTGRKLESVKHYFVTSIHSHRFYAFSVVRRRLESTKARFYSPEGGISSRHYYIPLLNIEHITPCLPSPS